MTTVIPHLHSLPRAVFAALACIVLVTACSSSPTTIESEIAPTTDTRHAVIARALQQIGAPYQINAAGPDRFDDSGLAYFAYRGASAELPRNRKAQLETGKPIEMAQAQPGDLVFFRIETANGGDRMLVGLYAAPGEIVMASPGGHEPPGVQLVETDGDTYWQQRQVAVIRVLPEQR